MDTHTHTHTYTKSPLSSPPTMVCLLASPSDLFAGPQRRKFLTFLYLTFTSYLVGSVLRDDVERQVRNLRIHPVSTPSAFSSDGD